MTENIGNWLNDAACVKTDPELFFDNSKAGIEEAKSFCVKCLVQNRCLLYALENNIKEGTWGNMSEAERAALKRRVAAEQKKQHTAALAMTFSEDYDI